MDQQQHENFQLRLKIKMLEAQMESALNEKDKEIRRLQNDLDLAVRGLAINNLLKTA
jgi:hypothetical protein